MKNIAVCFLILMLLANFGYPTLDMSNVSSVGRITENRINAEVPSSLATHGTYTKWSSNQHSILATGDLNVSAYGPPSNSVWSVDLGTLFNPPTARQFNIIWGGGLTSLNGSFYGDDFAIHHSDNFLVAEYGAYYWSDGPSNCVGCFFNTVDTGFASISLKGQVMGVLPLSNSSQRLPHFVHSWFLGLDAGNIFIATLINEDQYAGSPDVLTLNGYDINFNLRWKFKITGSDLRYGTSASPSTDTTPLLAISDSIVLLHVPRRSTSYVLDKSSGKLLRQFRTQAYNEITFAGGRFFGVDASKDPYVRSIDLVDLATLTSNTSVPISQTSVLLLGNKYPQTGNTMYPHIEKSSAAVYVSTDYNNQGALLTSLNQVTGTINYQILLPFGYIDLSRGAWVSTYNNASGIGFTQYNIVNGALMSSRSIWSKSLPYLFFFRDSNPSSFNLPLTAIIPDFPLIDRNFRYVVWANESGMFIVNTESMQFLHAYDLAIAVKDRVSDNLLAVQPVKIQQFKGVEASVSRGRSVVYLVDVSKWLMTVTTSTTPSTTTTGSTSSTTSTTGVNVRIMNLYEEHVRRGEVVIWADESLLQQFGRWPTYVKISVDVTTAKPVKDVSAQFSGDYTQKISLQATSSNTYEGELRLLPSILPLSCLSG